MQVDSRGHDMLAAVAAKDGGQPVQSYRGHNNTKRSHSFRRGGQGY